MSTSYVRMHEMTETTSFQVTDSLQSDEKLKLLHKIVIAISQTNLDIVENLLLDRSDPSSNNFQKWLSYDEITEYTRNNNAVIAVRSWIESVGADIIWESPRSDYIIVEGTVSVFERALKTKFYHWLDSRRNNKSPKTLIRAKEYFIPDYLSNHITSIYNVVDIPPIAKPQSYYYDENDNQIDSLTISNRELVSISSVASDAVTVSWLNKYYNIPSNRGRQAITQSIFSTNVNYYSSNDLLIFQNLFNLTKTTVTDINGNNAELSGVTCSTTTRNCNEGNLDIQYITGISQSTKTSFWHSDQFYEPLNWILSVASTTSPPSVHSISWIFDEIKLSTYILDNFNIEAMKLTAMGVTILASSGDDGVSEKASLTGICKCTSDSSSAISEWNGAPWTGQGYFPTFPCTSPYITAVGATMGPNRGGAEIACKSDAGGIITTGGGFSTYFPTPSWQIKAVNTYFNRSKGNSAGYNRFGRGYPDVSLIGVKYATIVNGGLVYQYGTSASAPVLAGMISLINSYRVLNNLTTVGFLNPLLYSAGYNQSTCFFRDITSGGNFCCSRSGSSPTCCLAGFNSTVGWDPVTGWGSVNYTSLFAMISVYHNNTGVSTGYANSISPSGSTSSSTFSGVIGILIIVGIVGGGLMLVGFIYISWLYRLRLKGYLLENNAGSVQMLITAPSAYVKTFASDNAIAALSALGFSEDESRTALEVAEGNRDLAYEYLTTGFPDEALEAYQKRLAKGNRIAPSELKARRRQPRSGVTTAEAVPYNSTFTV